jgi:lysyl-tRNA synthetase class 1
MNDDRNNHWAWRLARQVAARAEGRTAVFETGYGPSGAPHIGTVAEVLRTMMVVRAYREITGGAPVRVLAMTDDMDGMRKVPLNVSGREALEPFVGAPLCDVPSPWGGDSFAADCAAALRGHLRAFGLRPVEPAEALPRLLAGDATGPDEVLCLMSSDLYRGGAYDGMLLRVAAEAGRIAAIVAPTLRGERRGTWCPFVPLHEGRMVTDTRDWAVGADGRSLEWGDADGRRHVSPLLGGGAKLQWKADWAMRWVVLGVDFEMHGKDLADSVVLGSRISPLLGGRAPATFRYELFLDEDGAKLSKSVGNGASVAEWERHAPPGALWSFLARDPGRARRLGPGAVPQAVEDWLRDLRGPPGPSLALVHPEGAPAPRFRLSFATVLGVCALADADEPGPVWALLSGYDPGVDRADPLLSALVAAAVARHADVERPLRRYRAPDAREREALADLARRLRAFPDGSDGEAVQQEVYECGKAWYGKERLRDFFRMVYAAVLGREEGPRLGTLAEAVGPAFLADKVEAAAGR